SILYCSKNLNVEQTYEAASSDPRPTKLVLKPQNDESTSDFPKFNVQVCDSYFTCKLPHPVASTVPLIFQYSHFCW
ncbi:hypothetical protein B0H19DRAFT_1167704, partial [Mycena capillaripes]